MQPPTWSWDQIGTTSRAAATATVLTMYTTFTTASGHSIQVETLYPYSMIADERSLEGSRGQTCGREEGSCWPARRHLAGSLMFSRR